MDFIAPKYKDNFLITCEHCKAIICFSEEDCYCVKELDRIALSKGDFQNITRVYINCPSCNSRQDVLASYKYIKTDKNWW